jgi:solute carrier family 13 (sodium-dependent dicarboxylate transporter), member 2/3/5
MASPVVSPSPVEYPPHSGHSGRNLIGLAASIVIPLGFWFAPLNLNPAAKHAMAIASFMIVAWIAAVIPLAVTSMIGCYLFWILKVAKFEDAFGGFADQTPWFLFGAILFGMMATKSGLARRIAISILRRTGSGYSRLLLGMILTSFALTFLVPSGIACVVIMASVAIGLMEVLGLEKGSNVGRGLFVTLTYTAGTFDKVVLAGAASVLGRGLIEKSTGAHLYWSLWLLAFFPCALVVIFATRRLVLWLYPPEEKVLEGDTDYLERESKTLGPWSPAQKKSLLLMLIATSLWATDLLHHISPAAIGIGVGLIAAVPGVGVLETEDLRKLNFLPIIFTAAAISMSNILIQTQALRAMTEVMFGWMRPMVTNIYLIAVVPYWAAFLYHIMLGNELAMLATSVPPLMSFARSNGIATLPLALVWVFASGGKVFVYQSGVMVTGYSYGYFEPKDLVKIGFCLTVVESLALLLIVPFYWPHIGIR